MNTEELAAARADVDRLTHGKALPASRLGAGGDGNDDDDDDEIGPRPEPPSRSVSPGPRVGPAAPTVSDRQLAREVEAATASSERAAERKATRKTALERAEEIAPRAVGREGKMAEKRAANDENKKFREKDQAAGLEVDDDTLMGGSESGFAAAYV